MDTGASPTPRRTHRRPLALPLAMGFLVAACGSGVDRERLAKAQGARTEGTSSAAEPPAPEATAEYEVAEAAPPPAPALPSNPQASGSEATPGTAPKLAPQDQPTRDAASPAPKAATPATAPAPAPAPAPSAPAGGAPSPTSAPGIAPPIRLGSIGTDSGPIGAVLAPAVHGAKAWVADVNARGGLNGHPVEIVFGDDGADPSRGLALAKNMVEQQGVVAFFALHAPNSLTAIAPYMEENSIPGIEVCACAPNGETSPMVFPILGGPVGLTYAHVLPLLAMSDKRKVGVIYCRETPVCKLSSEIIAEAQSKLGIKVVYEAAATIAQPDYTAEVLAARNAGADALVLLMSIDANLRIARSAHRQGYFPVMSTQQAMSDDRVLTFPAEEIEGFLIGSQTAQYSTSPKMADFRSAMARYVPKGIKASMAGASWASGKLLEAMAGRFSGGAITSNDVLEGLYSLKGETAGGILPPMAFKRDQGHGDTNRCVFLVRIEKGTFTTPKGDQYVCDPDWKPVEP